MLDLQIHEHNDIEDLSAFDIQFEKRRTGWQDLDGVWHCQNGLVRLKISACEPR